MRLAMSLMHGTSFLLTIIEPPPPLNSPAWRRVETLLGVMMVARFRAVRFVADFGTVSFGHGNFWEDYQYSRKEGIR